MTFVELLKQIKTVELHEIRVDLPEKLEVVSTNQNLSQLTAFFDQFFGKPLKAPNEFPSGIAKKYAGPYGGIRSDQTLYCLHDGEVCSFVMIWPWSDNMLSTVKIFQDKVAPVSAPSGKAVQSFFKRFFE
ncbi:MAG: hypothetical protein A3G33_03040 [Omnitrophica bacterium RIFCSPLOWO2_12_FULL_44_17]|uniref:Uncharacterized protein n=1 Tax=Candidatus Danuiimicrobium aquiferis TaxID=1801832 RepID=A0A1G1KVQ1_9BACT|nr:MAG: hypothetical protein A3B72_04520 [Omnitrophica bacterium RIFCSPHIGHO2_02_FULL_45_28]OGW96955.1 MAG: hypothetical protein A3G33_03040 [Omnitrophica bacterium RIFCSPLOWO2_12_FULL_44_17]OGX03910.1 MAG: hypothetical protein A3J12_03375 [Omnitrophica bacterium RIFCSPLOWO2_02_FULL_44_11]